MKLKNGFVTSTIMGKQVMVAAGKASNHFNGMVRSNKTAAFIVDCLKKDTTEEEIVKKMLEKYDVTPEVAAQDVKKIIAKLQTIGALE